MAIVWNDIKTAVATAMANALAAAQSEAFATFPMPATALSATFTWNGTSTVTTPDTSEVTAGDPVGPPVVYPSYIRYGETGNWYKVLSVVLNTSVTVEDTFGVGSFPSGAVLDSYVADGPVPDPPSSSSLEDKLAVPIVNAIFDGVEDALDDAEISGVSSGGDTIGPGVIS